MSWSALAFTMTEGPRSRATATRVKRQQEQRAFHRRIDINRLLRDRSLPTKVKQPVDDPLATLDLSVDELEVFQLTELERKALGAGRDRRQRIVDLMHHAGSQLPNSSHFFRLGNTLQRFFPLGDVFADRNDVSDAVAFMQMHWDLRDPIRPGLATRPRLSLELLELPGAKDPIDLALE